MIELRRAVHLADLLTRLRATTTARGRTALETAIRDRSRLVGNAGRLLQPVRSSELDAALHSAGDAALAVWFARRGRLADLGEVRSAAERMAFATHRLSAPGGGAGSGAGEPAVRTPGVHLLRCRLSGSAVRHPL
ncbi:hypothetical protein [Micropruina glycogenica]|uniref:Uncharacterized protein n=1 Tax=Micropruina glycogenica TaxID=75385 RepID=A0A2N9JFX2_9ACTN|nr:hypothetical protein [Micropruina glycogenica]SPD87014.1 protein of unknown function [Micropruina glycogenica]